jgi:hypothetical protein
MPVLKLGYLYIYIYRMYVYTYIIYIYIHGIMISLVIYGPFTVLDHCVQCHVAEAIADFVMDQSKMIAG